MAVTFLTNLEITLGSHQLYHLQMLDWGIKILGRKQQFLNTKHHLTDTLMKYLGLIIFAMSFSFNCYVKDSHRVSLGIGQFNFMEDGTPPHKDQSQMLNLEVYSNRKLFNLVFAGFLGTTSTTYYAYGGFGIDGYYGKKRTLL